MLHRCVRPPCCPISGGGISPMIGPEALFAIGRRHPRMVSCHARCPGRLLHRPGVGACLTVFRQRVRKRRRSGAGLTRTALHTSASLSCFSFSGAMSGDMCTDSRHRPARIFAAHRTAIGFFRGALHSFRFAFFLLTFASYKKV